MTGPPKVHIRRIYGIIKARRQIVEGRVGDLHDRIQDVWYAWQDSNLRPTD